jgi:hypothetical protein
MTNKPSGRLARMPMFTCMAGRRLILALVVALGVSLSVAIAVAAAAGRTEERRSVQALLADSLRADHGRSGPSDDQYYANGRWLSDDDAYWPTTIAPATAAAVLYRQTHAPWLAKVSVATINRAIATYRQTDGSFGETSKGNDIATMVFASELGRSYLALGDALSRETRAEWRGAVRSAADFLISNGNLAWYTNGNIVLGNAEIMALAYRITGEARYHSAYLRAFSFAIAPPQDRWPGFGLHLTKVPVRGDGSDGAGYLAEAPSPDSTPGFDAEYTQLQLDVASRIYLLMRDTRSLQLTNELTNALLPRVDRRTWSLDTSGGTRHPERGRKIPFTTPALSVLAWQGARKGFDRLAKSQFVVVDQQYRSALRYSSANFYRGLGDQLAPILEAASDHRGDAASSTS